MVIARLCLVVLLVSIAAACGNEESPRPTEPIEVRITEVQHQASTALKIGHVLRVELPAQPLQACAWELVSVDESVLRVPVEEYVPPDREDEPGTAVWRFEAIGPGTTTLTMRYVNFAEDPPADERTFTFRVLVD